MKRLFIERDRMMLRGSRHLVLTLAVLLGLMVVAGTILVAAQGTNTITLMSGDGAVGERDSTNEVSTDGGATWEDAYIIAKNPNWADPILGTNWIFCGPTHSDACGVSSSGKVTAFRTSFELPPGFANPSLTIDVHADNVVRISLNGTQFAEQGSWGCLGSGCPTANFLQDPDTFSTNDASLFQEGTNVLSFSLWDGGGSAGLDYKATVTYDLLEVALDIHPTSCPNPQNVGRGGVLPAAILGTADFDVTQIDPSSVLLEGVSPLRWSLEDVAAPYTNGISDPPDRMDCTDKGSDGFLDLTLKFDAQEIVAALGDVEDGDVVVVTLTGELLDDTAIAGEDVVWIVKKGNGGAPGGSPPGGP